MIAALRATEWNHFRDYISPTVFEVLPAGALAREMAGLAGNFGRGRAFDQVVAQRGLEWAVLHPRIELVDELPGAPLEQEGLTGVRRERAGHAVLVLFFRLVLGGGEMLLDLRPSRLAHAEDVLAWQPARLWTTWSEDFSRAVRDLYHGFYAGDDARFARALEALQLAAAEPAMRRHFGSGDQRAVRFELETFHSTFHDIFTACRQEGARLDAGFIGLGLLLAALYETMEHLGGAFDVRAAWEAATR